MSRRSLAIVLLIVLSGCAGTIVRPNDIPSASGTPLPGRHVLALADAPAPMAEEVRRYVGTGATEVRLGASDSLASACSADTGFVLRPSMGRKYFVTNTGDRNALFIYESAIVVGIPVTLISAVAWPWYGETTLEGKLESLSCHAPTDPKELVESFRLRSEGRGFVRGETVRSAQEDAATRAVTRKLLRSWSQSAAQ